MLVVDRKINQTIIIDLSKATDADIRLLRSGAQTIDIQVTEIFSNSVRIGTSAPRSVMVDRFELWRDKNRVVSRNPNPHAVCTGAVI